MNTKKLEEISSSNNSSQIVIAKQDIFSTQLSSELKSFLMTPNNDVIENKPERIDLIYPESRKIDFNWRIFLMFRGAPENSIKK